MAISPIDYIVLIKVIAEIFKQIQKQATKQTLRQLYAMQCSFISLYISTPLHFKGKYCNFYSYHLTLF